MKYLDFIFLIILISTIVLFSCTGKKNTHEVNTNKSLEIFSGWWIYGEGQHIFKDEQSLKEFDLIFPNEDSLGLIELYLSVTEMEYFPMETDFTGVISEDYILQVDDFEITYIQGCDEE